MTQRSRFYAVTCSYMVGVTMSGLVSCDRGGTRTTSGKPPAVTRALACKKPASTAMAAAVREFIKTSTPAPQRFLMAAGTDSALPEAGFNALQDKGPSFYYSSDTVAQRKMREKLANDGPYASMLVVYHGKTESADGNTVTVSLGGHFIGGVQEGKIEPTRQIAVVCDSSGWHVTPPQSGVAP